MIQKQTILIPSDKSGVWLTRTIHTYSKLSKILVVNFFGKISVREASSSSWLQKKKKKKFLLTRSSQIVFRRCGLNILTIKSNLILKKRLSPVGRRVVGFLFAEVRRKKAISSFVKIL
jgi:ribosomal protein L14